MRASRVFNEKSFVSSKFSSGMQVDHSLSCPTSHAQASRRFTAVRSVTSRKNHAIMRDPNLNTNILHISGPFIHIITVLPLENGPLLTVRREIPHYRAKVAAMTPRATVEVSSSFHYISPSQHTLYTSLCILTHANDNYINKNTFR